ncbi:MAG TPA: RelA/SpoT domain-containing protein [Pyrinomonadaceae bacterium]|nr:RelA/SpoT domain-containing protein [Pyrinomonadaceae bacterium]
MDFDTYSRSKRADYAVLADTVASILRAAIAAHPVAFRLQLAQARAKDPESLKKKLEDRGQLGTTTLAEEIKDLAGCRLIFYSNSDVTRFQQSGIVTDNFDVDWDRTKIHHPVPGDGDPKSLFISDNFVVSLKEDRTKLPEYARFAGLACEVQVQTTLNHTWSEMEHDILYKRPKLTGFGGKLFEAIERRFETIMKTYLLPAGYEFQKAISDYDRLISGKQLFDSGALKALSDCADNNARLELLERFRNYVLPNYDDPVSVYPEIKDSIIAAIKAARLTKPREIETPGGNFPGVSVERVVKVASEILGQVRYVSIEGTFEAICDVFPGALDDTERKHLLDLIHELAVHELEVWKRAGPMVQVTLVRKVRDFDEDRVPPVLPVLLKVLEEALSTEVQGTTSTYNTMTLHRGSVVASDALREMRSEAISILCNLYRSAGSEDENKQIKRVLFAATAMPTSTGYSNQLLADVLNDSARVVDFFSDLAGTNDYEIIQSVEHRLLWMHRRNKGIRTAKDIDAAVLAAVDCLHESIQLFRTRVESNKGFVTYKTLVGFKSVFPPMWESEGFRYEEEQEYRSKRIDDLVADVTEKNADGWFAIINRCAQTKSDDLATFPSFGEFLQRLGRDKPSIVLGFIDRLEKPLTGFLGIMLSGLAQSSQSAALDTRIEEWLAEDRYLVQIAHYFKFAPRLDGAMLKRLFEAGIRLNDEDVIVHVLATAFRRYKDGTAALIDEVILPGVTYFTNKQDARWVNLAWFVPKADSFVRDLTDHGVEVILQSLLHAPHIDTHAEFILIHIANARPTRVFDFFVERLKFSTSSDAVGAYDPIPYEFYELKNRFEGIADHAVDTARRLFVSGDVMFQFTGGRLIYAAFPALSDALNRKLMSLVETGTHEDLEFTIRVLSSYRGEPFVEPLCNEIIRRLPADDGLRNNVELVLQATGVVTGEFGLVEAYKGKRNALAPWLSDTDEKVRSFAQEYIASLDRQIAAEQRRSEEELEMRKRRYEDLEKGDEE